MMHVALRIYTIYPPSPIPDCADWRWDAQLSVFHKTVAVPEPYQASDGSPEIVVTRIEIPRAGIWTSVCPLEHPVDLPRLYGGTRGFRSDPRLSPEAPAEGQKTS